MTTLVKVLLNCSSDTHASYYRTNDRSRAPDVNNLQLRYMTGIKHSITSFSDGPFLFLDFFFAAGLSLPIPLPFFEEKSLEAENFFQSAV